MPLKDIVQTGLVSCPLGTPVLEIAKLMDTENVGAVLVTEKGKAAGIVTDRDLVLRCVVKQLDPESTTVEEVMTPVVETISENQGIYEAIHTLKNGVVRRVVVVDEGGMPTGLLSFDDLFELIAEEISALKDVVQPENAKIVAQTAA